MLGSKCHIHFTMSFVKTLYTVLQRLIDLNAAKKSAPSLLGIKEIKVSLRWPGMTKQAKISLTSLITVFSTTFQ